MQSDIFFDIIIFGFLIFCGLVILLLRRKMSTPVYCLLIVSWLAVFYGSFIEPQLITVTEQEIALAENPQTEIRAVLVSDFHAGPYKKDAFIKRAVKKILSLKPDVILLAGDFAYDEPETQIQLLDDIRSLQAPLGVFATLGNHDYAEKLSEIPGEEAARRSRLVKDFLEAHGIRVLVNETTEIQKGERSIQIFGTDEYLTGRTDLAKITTSSKKPTVILSHNPDIVQSAAELVPLVLAGHTHGGQIRLPFIGPVPKIPDELGKKYDQGLFQYSPHTQLFITRGLGETGPRARLFAPPEIALLKIRY